jgi:hypothetical protein
MRSLRGELRHDSLFLMWLFAGGMLVLAQSQDPSLPAPPGQTVGRVPFGQRQEPNQDPAFRHAEEEAAKRRNIERQNKMVADSDKICALAQEFSDQINKGAQDALSPASVRKIEEIEKLAKGVKDRMRSD